MAQRKVLCALLIGAIAGVSVMALSMWQGNVQSKYKSVTDYFSGGVNTIQPAHMLADDVLSDAIGATVAKNGALGFSDNSAEDAVDHPVISLTNVVANGNFASSSGWLVSGGVLNVSSNIGTVTGDGSSDKPRVSRLLTADPGVGDVIYAKARVRVTNPTCSSISIVSTEGITPVTLATQVSPAINTWYVIDSTFTCSDNVVNIGIVSEYASAAAANGQSLQVQYVVMINMTKDIGEAYEFNEYKIYNTLINNYGTPCWFDGTDSDVVVNGFAALTGPNQSALLAYGNIGGEEVAVYENGWVIGGDFYSSAGSTMYPYSHLYAKISKLCPFADETVKYAAFYQPYYNASGFDITPVSGQVGAYTIKIKYVELPLAMRTQGVTVEHMENHLNRLFLSYRNSIHWTAAGTYDTFYASSIGSNYVSEDSGYWTFEGAGQIMGLLQFRGVLYIFFEKAVYGLFGDKPENFYVQKVLDNIGSSIEVPLYYKDDFATISLDVNIGSIAKTSNFIYFVSGDCIYQWDGSSYPIQINHPIFSNGSYINGIKSGVDINVDYSVIDGNGVYGFQGLVGGSNKLFAYQLQYLETMNTDTNIKDIQTVIWEFDEQTRSWWKHNGFSDIASNTTYTAPSYTIDVWSGGSNIDGNVRFYCNILYWDKNPSIEREFGFYHKMSNIPPDDGPYMVTRAYGDSLSSKQTLSDIYIQLSKRDVGTTQYNNNIYVYVNPTIDDEDAWVLISPPSMYDVLLDEKIQTFRLIVPHSVASGVGSYRIKIVVEAQSENDTGTVYLHQLQRRYRVRE